LLDDAISAVVDATSDRKDHGLFIGCRCRWRDGPLLLHHSGARLHAKPADTPAAPEREDYYGR
jgi:hypothetical protein